MNATEPKAPIFDLLESLIKELAPARDRFPRAFEDLERLNREIQQKLARFGEEEQQLSIGVMGRVKAGKSSFLNALLFDGKPILPIAATPETANLVRITYRDEPRLAVEFYSMDEWREIETQAKGDEAFESTQVAAKLVEMANRRDLDWD
jgi:predicted GTPase